MWTVAQTQCRAHAQAESAELLCAGILRYMTKSDIYAHINVIKSDIYAHINVTKSGIYAHINVIKYSYEQQKA